MKLYQALAIACTFGALWGGQLAAEGHMLHKAIDSAERHLVSPGKSDPSLSLVATLLTLGYVVLGRDDPALLAQARQDANLRLYGGGALAGLSVLALLWLGVYHLRTGRHAA